MTNQNRNIYRMRHIFIDMREILFAAITRDRVQDNVGAQPVHV